VKKILLADECEFRKDIPNGNAQGTHQIRVAVQTQPYLSLNRRFLIVGYVG